MDLVVHDFRTVGRGLAHGFDGIGGRAERMSAHVADGDGLTGGSSRGGRGTCHLAGGDAADEAATDLRSGVQLSPGERPGAGDGRARTIVSWSFGLEEAEDPFCAVRGPSGEETSVGFAERLRRPHRSTVRRKVASVSLTRGRRGSSKAARSTDQEDPIGWTGA